MELEILTEWNPWWGTGKVPGSLKGKKRPKYKNLLESVDAEEVTIITGIRRSGKSTLMYQMTDNLLSKGVSAESILYLNLEDVRLAEYALDDIYATYRQKLNPSKKAYIFLDEVHKRDGWESWIRRRYDQKQGDKFIVSGSSSYLLRREYSTLLTGRNLTFEVFPLDFSEFLEFSGLRVDSNKAKKGIVGEKTKLQILNLLELYLEEGGFPKPTTEKKHRHELLRQYFDDIIYKDLIDRFGLNSQKTNDLAVYLATNFTSFVSLRGIRHSLGLSYDTIRDYRAYFTEAFMFFCLDHFSYSLKEQKTLASKTYCIDNGMRNAVSFRFSKDLGRLAENLVFIELKRRGKQAYYWKGKGEVDFVIKAEELTAINVTYSDEIHKREINSLQEFGKRFGTNKLILLTKNTEKTESGVSFIPLWKWLLKG